MPEKIVGVRQFSDGILRNVFEDARGQYVVNNLGHKVHGSWIDLEEDLRDLPRIAKETVDPA
jgi:hypothetical protein